MSPFLILLVSAPLLAGSIDVGAVLLNPSDHRVIVEKYRQRVEKLKACGASVKEVGFKKEDEAKKEKSLATIAGRVRAAKLTRNPVYLIEGHGIVNEMVSAGTEGKKLNGVWIEKEVFEPKFEGPLGLYFADRQIYSPDLLAALSKGNSETAIWVDTCHSGHCTSFPDACVGAACGSSQMSQDDNRATDFIVDLLCSESSDCRLWNKVDRDGNGVITGPELARGMRDGGAALPIKQNSRNVARAKVLEAEKELAKSCPGGTVKIRKLGYPIVAKIRKSDGTETISQYDQALTGKTGAFVDEEPPFRNWLKDRLEKIREFDGAGGEIRAEALDPGGPFYEVYCEQEVIGSAPAEGGMSQSGVIEPQLDRFRLKSDTCRTAGHHSEKEDKKSH